MANTVDNDRTPSEYDTPESVDRKFAMIHVIVAMWNHYIVDDHPGDYESCTICDKPERPEGA